jgi:hypothetical protein
MNQINNNNMYAEDREENMAQRDGSQDFRKHVDSKDRKIIINKDGTKTIWYTDGSAAHEGVMVGRTNYDKDTGEEC